MSPDNGKTLPELAEVVPVREIYPVADVAILLGVSTRKVWTLIDQGRLKTLKLDGRRLVPHDEVMAFRDSLPDATFATHPGGQGGLDGLAAWLRPQLDRRQQQALDAILALTPIGA